MPSGRPPRHGADSASVTPLPYQRQLMMTSRATSSSTARLQDAPFVAAGNVPGGADRWYASIDDWMYVTNTDLARLCGVAGYYVRVAAPDQADAESPKDGFVPIKNRPASESRTTTIFAWTWKIRVRRALRTDRAAAWIRLDKALH